MQLARIGHGAASKPDARNTMPLRKKSVIGTVRHSANVKESICGILEIPSIITRSKNLNAAKAAIASSRLCHCYRNNRFPARFAQERDVAETNRAPPSAAYGLASTLATVPIACLKGTTTSNWQPRRHLLVALTVYRVNPSPG
jgi:hypothetical protein